MVELVVFGLIALLLGTGVLWLAGWLLGAVGTVLLWLAGLIWALLRFIVPVALIAGLVVLVVRMVRGHEQPQAGIPPSAAPGTTPGAAPQAEAPATIPTPTPDPVTGAPPNVPAPTETPSTDVPPTDTTPSEGAGVPGERKTDGEGGDAERDAPIDAPEDDRERN